MRLDRRGAIATVCCLAGLATAGALGTPEAPAAQWHLSSAFGRGGIAGLPLRERGIDSLYPAGPGDQGTLLALGPQGSVFVGGYAERKPGVLLIAQLSARGRLVKGFGHGGVAVVAAIHSTPQRPARIIAAKGRGLLIVGLDSADRVTVLRLGARGALQRSFGHRGVARYAPPGTSSHAIVAAAEIESSGDILVAYYARERSQPVNEPMTAPGLGDGPLGLLRLTPSGSLDSSFGSGGFLTSSGESPAAKGPAVGVTLTPTGSILLAYEEATLSGAGFTEAPAVEELAPTGSAQAGFGNGGLALLPFIPSFRGTSSVLFGGLFALPGGGIEASFGGGGQLFRFTSAGTPDTSFGSGGHSNAGPASAVMTLAPDGETFSANHRGALTVTGTLGNGQPDPALGSKGGERFTAHLPGPRPGEEQQPLELLAGAGDLTVLLSEDLVRISR
jgi:hypothetical protein